MLYILDTDHLSLQQRGHQQLLSRFNQIPSDEIAITVITVEEQFRGRLAQIRGAKSDADLMQALHFLGIEKDYRCRELLIPHKKPKKQELTQEQKGENKLLASERIVVEHSIAGLKRYQILSDRLRMHDLDL